MNAMILALLLAQAPADRPAPPPLSEEQVTRLRDLIRQTQERTTALTAQLEAKERELAGIYGEFQLDQARAAAVEAEIVELQRQKLANYHRMQVELRTIVDKERFDALKQRLRLAGFFGPAPKPPEKKPSEKK
jgi:hypothetical protein